MKDIKDFQQQIRYYLRYSNDHPKFGRYTWKQKFEYFGAGFGAVIMGFTGILMWHPFGAMQYLPLGIVQIANLFHTWEAVLALEPEESPHRFIPYSGALNVPLMSGSDSSGTGLRPSSNGLLATLARRCTAFQTAA